MSSVFVLADDSTTLNEEAVVENVDNKVIDKAEDVRYYPMPKATLEVPLDSAGYETRGLLSSWVVEPYVYKTERRIRYNTTWLTIDNYNSAVPVVTSSEKEKKVTMTAGFSGSGALSLSEALDVGLEVSGSYASESTTKFSTGYTVPAWFKVGQRAYIRYERSYIKGKIRRYIPSLPVGYYVEEWVEATNDRVYEEGEKFKSYENTNEKPTSNVPSFPSSWEE